jgi:protein-S-isoprenylcysteine O-methyltransferase Ste14
MEFRQIAQRIRVPAGFVILPLLLIASNPSFWWLVAGSALTILGLGVRAWASGYLKKNKELTTAGPYAYTRNPLYLGTFVMGSGIAVSTGTVWFIVVFAALYILIYLPVMSAEAETMSEMFPNEYRIYRREVPPFFPRLTPYKERSPKRFEIDAYIRHREYRAALGVAAVYALIAAKFLIVS